MKKKKKSKQVQSETIDLDRDVALSEAANTLGRAAALAFQNKDVDNLLQAAAGWIELSHRLDPPDKESETEEIKKVMGFTPPEKPQIREVPGIDVED